MEDLLLSLDLNVVNEDENKEQVRNVVNAAVRRGCKKHGYRVKCELVKLGWINKSDASEIHTDYYVSCGVNGAYNCSHLVKGVKK